MRCEIRKGELGTKDRCQREAVFLADVGLGMEFATKLCPKHARKFRTKYPGTPIIRVKRRTVGIKNGTETTIWMPMENIRHKWL